MSNFRSSPRRTLLLGLALSTLLLLFMSADLQAQTFTRTCTGDEAAGSRRLINEQLTRFRRTDTMIFNNVPDGAVIAFSTSRTANGRPSGLRFSSTGTQSRSVASFNSGILSVGASRSFTINAGDDGSTGVDNGSIRLNIAAVTNNRSTPSAIRQRWSATCTPPDISISSLETGASVVVADGGTDAHGVEPAGTSKVVEYVITNTLGGTLTIDGPITISGLTNVTSATVTTQPSDTSLTAGETTSFFVTYTPTLPGPFSFDIVVPNTDFAENAYDIEVTGSSNVPPSVVLTGPTGPQSGPFTVTATFSEPVTGLTLSEFVVGNGTASSFVMVSPGVYTILVTPTTQGSPVTISLPTGTAVDTDNTPNTASNTLSINSGSLSEEQTEEVQKIIVTEATRALREELRVNQRANREARERHAAARRCRALQDEDELDDATRIELEAECDPDGIATRNVPLTFGGALQANPDTANLVGTFFSEANSYDGKRRRIFTGGVDLSRFNGGNVSASLTARLAWEQAYSKDTLLGYFIGANASHTKIDGSFAGTRIGYGVTAGAYFVDALGENLYWDGFAAISFGQNDLDIRDTAFSVGSGYDTSSIQLGLALSGYEQYRQFELRPELSATYGYTDIGSVGLDVSTPTSTLRDALAAGRIELGRITFEPEFIIPVEVISGKYDESSFRIAPSVICEYLNSTSSSSDCGGGLRVEWTGTSNDNLNEFSIELNREVIGGTARSSFGLQLESEF